jgi:hypothetical protein
MDFLPIECLEMCMMTTKQLRKWRLDAKATENCDLLELERQVLFAAIFYKKHLVNREPFLAHSTLETQKQYPCPHHSCRNRTKTYNSAGLEYHQRSVVL